MSGDGGRATGRVIVVGSINVDLVMRLPRLPAPGETVLGGLSARHQGGKGANQAVAAARAGAVVHMIGAVGAHDGEEAVAALSAEGIAVDGVTRCDVPTGLAAVLVDAESGENQIAVASGANDLVNPAQVRGSLTALGLRPADVVVLSFELPEAPLRAAAVAARAAGARLVVNPAPATDGRAGLLAQAIVTPNMPELATLVTQSGLTSGMTPQAAAMALARRTGGPVIATMGADGALLAEAGPAGTVRAGTVRGGTGGAVRGEAVRGGAVRGDAVPRDAVRGGAGAEQAGPEQARPGEAGTAEHFAGHRVSAVDTTGAGDTLTGVLAASLALGYELRASVRRAVAAAALAVTKPGARAGMPTTAEIERLLN
jgi:ribokinase